MQMRFVSTRGAAPPATFSEAMLHGLAPDGGLYVPQSWPSLPDPLGDEWIGLAYPTFAEQLLAPFLVGDRLSATLSTLCSDAFDFPVPLVGLGHETAILELFHGPTAAFKDFGARFLATGLTTLLKEGAAAEPLRILVATSGDTGAAVAAACHRRSGLEVGVLFPKGGVSPRQERQLTCWEGNVQSFAVRGSFDDCQRMTKEIFNAGVWPSQGSLTSANSINIGRLLPQVVYAAQAAVEYRTAHGIAPSVVVPSGNLGNVVAVYWAKRLGFPIGEVAIATNANTVVAEWFSSGEWNPHPSVRTLANAMDVGDPSNMERLLQLFEASPELRAASSAASVDDPAIRATIRDGEAQWGRAFCPHTATAVHLRQQLASPHWIVFATAHPAKFEEIVEPLVGHAIDVPPALAALLDRPARVTEIDAEASALQAAWR